jgi:hypothetical protein
MFLTSAKLTMAEFGNTRILRKCGIFLCVDQPGLRFFAPSGLRLLVDTPELMPLSQEPKYFQPRI